MSIKIWELPIKAEWHRSTELESLSFDRDGLTLVLIEEDSGRHWCLRFAEVQAFKCVTEESAADVLGALPTNGAFYEVVDSPWLSELGRGKLEYMAQARHYVICCYDEILEVVASSHHLEGAGPQ